MSSATPQCLPPAPLQLGAYTLVPLRAVRCDDVRAFLGHEPGIYIVNSPEEAWYAHIRQHAHMPVGNFARKQRMFAHMATGSQWISMTFDAARPGAVTDWQSPKGVMHLGQGRLRGRAAQVWMAVKLTRRLFAQRSRYHYCLVYNVDLPQLIAPLLAKVCLGKKLILDYEDDYTCVRSPGLRNRLDAALRSCVDGAVCINTAMVPYFAGRPTCVANSFANLDYARTACYELREGMTWLYSGRLDDVGGAALLPDLVQALRARLKKFRIVVTGGGPLAAAIRRWGFAELDYLGFVSPDCLQKLIAEADACLVLQPPDHPFSLGSYPSKIETYASLQKPIYVLERARVNSNRPQA